MTPRFDKALAWTLRFEGGYVDHPDDPGGVTMRGITQARYDGFRRRIGVERRPVGLITDVEIREIYWRYYWLAGRCDLLPPPVDVVHFDGFVLLARPIELLQATVDLDGTVKTDGELGAKTLAAVLRWEPRDLAAALATARIGYHVRSLQRFGNQSFIEGWVSRAQKLRAAVRSGELG